MHLFHKWENVVTREATVYGTRFFKEYKETAIVHLERCKVCGKERAYITTLNEEKRYIDPEFVKGKI